MSERCFPLSDFESANVFGALEGAVFVATGTVVVGLATAVAVGVAAAVGEGKAADAEGLACGVDLLHAANNAITTTHDTAKSLFLFRIRHSP
jgi:hypothetical protein